MADQWRNDPLAEVMTGNVIRTPFDSTLLDVQDLLTKSRLARLVVTDRARRLRGIITRRDVVRFLSADKTQRPLDTISVREAMSTPVITLRPTDTLTEAAQAMNKKGISSIVVTDEGGEIVGIVTKTDLCFHFSLFTSKEKVGYYMTRKVFTVRPTHSIFFAASLLAKQGISRVLVVDDRILRHYHARGHCEERSGYATRIGSWETSSKIIRSSPYADHETHCHNSL